MKSLWQEFGTVPVSISLRREPVRLVIWDLDETLWRGTLTEGGITAHVSANYEVIKRLAQRGIVSSICSKNDFAMVRDILVAQDVWDYFVFPSIDWSGKGARIATIVDAMHLRPETVLFIDDNALKRAQATEIVPGLQVSDECIIETILDHPSAQGKPDPAMSRLNHYKVLEQKAEARTAVGDRRDEFLRASAIRVEIDHDVTAHLDRVVELINRANQLNFTKRRLPDEPAAARRELLQELHAKPGRRSAVVRVEDRFGDYGIVGFWMMDGIWVEPYLIHYVFSCRTLGMGIEQWVYEKLGRPNLTPVGDVVSTLDGCPDWINRGAVTDNSTASTGAGPQNVRLRGGCELEVVKHFFSFRSRSVVSEFVFPRRGQTIWSSHTITLFPQPALDTAAGRTALAEIGFKAEDFRTSFFDAAESGSCLVLSNSADAHVTLYRHRGLDFVVPVKLFGIDVSGPLEEAAIEQFCNTNGLQGDEAAQFQRSLRVFKANFVPVPFASVDWQALYDRMAQVVPEHSLLVLLLPITHAINPAGGTVEFEDQKLVNAWLRQLADRYANVRVVDTADCLRSDDELRNFSHLHFARDVYFRLYERIVGVYNAWSASRDSGYADTDAGRLPGAASVYTGVRIL